MDRGAAGSRTGAEVDSDDGDRQSVKDDLNDKREL